MVRTKGTTPKALQLKMNQESTTTNNGGGESSFRVMYYGDASAGSVPFMWESRPGTPKHLTTKSTIPPLTPPPAYNQLNQKYNSSKHTTSLQTLFHSTSSRQPHVSVAPTSSYNSSKYTISLQTLFHSTSSRQTHVSVAPTSSTSDSFTSYGSCSRKPTSLRSLFLASSFRRDHVAVSNGGGKTEFRRSGGHSTTETRCFGGGFMMVYRMKKVKSALMSIGRHGKIHNN
ncbi:hypothetical protein HanRHA438_Chr09g0394831 [Helianthus annuus]|nr:hypothetical protein HanRHA438_Chr09g0394831 [Helianthus annuus]